MPWYLYLAFVAAGFIAGFINTLAGSGSLVILPLLIFIGMPATVANGTNRVGVLLQNVVGVGAFNKSKVFDLRGVLWLSLPAVLGSILGAQIAISLDEKTMERVIGAVMLLMLGVILFDPKRWIDGQRLNMTARPTWIQFFIFFLIGIYGGFIQAGVGIFLLAALVLSVGYDLVRANAVKVGIVLLFTMAALVVFVRNDQVDWFVGLILAVGNMLGAWVAARVAVERGAAWVRRLLIVIVVLSAAQLLGLFDLLIL